jgi:beta-aspartyl-peptidase (threonine type)
LIGLGADQFADEVGLEIVKPSYFWTPERWEQLKKELKQDSHSRAGRRHQAGDEPAPEKHGTVGCVAVDVFGNVAAGTSTGGISSQHVGRVGDAPIIGAGTYAANDGCAVSATGHGEFFMRHVVAHDISCLVKYKGFRVEQAAAHVVGKTLKEAGGVGGVIAVDAKGDFAMEFNSQGMYRGYILPDGQPHAFIFKDE